MKLIRAYLRASTKEQDAKRAKDELQEFIERYDNCVIASFYIENESGTKQSRPELERLIFDISLQNSQKTTERHPTHW